MLTKRPCVWLLARAVMALLVGMAAVYAHGDLHEAITALTAAIARDPNNVQLQVQRAELYLQHHEWEAGLADCAEAMRRSSDTTDLMLLRAKLSFGAGHAADARLDIDRFLAAIPQHAEAHLLRARILVALKQHVAAGDDYAAAIAGFAQPQPDHYIEYAQMLAAAGPEHIDAALVVLDRGLVHFGQLVTLQTAAIDLERTRGRYDAALARLEALRPTLPRAELYLAQKAALLEQAGRTGEANAAYATGLASLASLPMDRRTNVFFQQLDTDLTAGLARTTASKEQH